MSSDIWKVISVLVDDTEQNIKQIEEYNDEFPMPILNEWRYVTRHIVNSHFKSNGKDVDNELKAAVGHLKRASYDSFGILLSAQINLIGSIKEKTAGYTDIVKEYIDDYSAWQLKVKEGRKILDGLPGGLDKENVHSRLKVLCRELQEYIRIIEATQEDWEAAIKKQKLRDLIKYAASIATIIGVILALIQSLA